MNRVQDFLTLMKSDAVAFGVAGILFGLIAGWVIGSQQAAQRAVAPAPAAQSAPAQSAPPPPMLDQAKVNAFTTMAEREPKNAAPRVQLGNLYFDSERYEDAIKWYSEALALQPNDADLSTDLGVSYYYLNQPDKALAQFDRSLQIDPKHTKTLLNLGIVRAFGKQDLAGAQEAWERVIKIAPDSPEAQAAKRAIDTLRAAHPSTGGSSQKPGA